MIEDSLFRLTEGAFVSTTRHVPTKCGIDGEIKRNCLMKQRYDLISDQIDTYHQVEADQILVC